MEARVFGVDPLHWHEADPRTNGARRRRLASRWQCINLFAGMGSVAAALSTVVPSGPTTRWSSHAARAYMRSDFRFDKNEVVKRIYHVFQEGYQLQRSLLF